MIIGEEALEKEFNRFSLCVMNNPLEASYVLVGMDCHFTYEKLNEAMNVVMNGAKLIVTNPDFVCPVPEGCSRHSSNQQHYCCWGKSRDRSYYR